MLALLAILFVGWTEMKERPQSALPVIGCWAVAGFSLLLGLQGYLLAYALSVLALVGGCALIIRYRTLQAIKAKREENERLRSLLLAEHHRDGNAPPVSIAAADYKQLAGIEKALIALQRTASIRQTYNEPIGDSWPVLQSKSVLQKTAELDAATRQTVQLRIDQLSVNPKPADARSDGSMWTVRVPGSSRAIVYPLTENPHTILVQDVHEAESELQEQAGG